MIIKEKLHKIIDEITDEQTLKSFLNLFNSLKSDNEGELYASLSTSQKEELMISYDESFKKDNLLKHAAIKKDHSKWL